MNDQRKQWVKWLGGFRQRFIAAQKWTEKEARLRLCDGWACIRGGDIQAVLNISGSASLFSAACESSDSRASGPTSACRKPPTRRVTGRSPNVTRR